MSDFRTDGRGVCLVGMRKLNNGNIKVGGRRDVRAFNRGQEQQRIPAENAGKYVNYRRRGILPVCLGWSRSFQKGNTGTWWGIILKEQSSLHQINIFFLLLHLCLDGTFCLGTSGRLMGTKYIPVKYE